MGVKRVYTGSISLCWCLVALAGMGSGIHLDSAWLSFGLLIPAAAGCILSLSMGTKRSGPQWVDLSIRLVPVAAMLLLFVLVPYPAKGRGADLVLAGFLAAESLLLLNPAGRRAAPEQAALVASGHMIFVTALGGDARLLVIALLFVLGSISFWMRIEARIPAPGRRQDDSDMLPGSGRPRWLLIFNFALVCAILLFFLIPRTLFDSTRSTVSRIRATGQAARNPSDPTSAEDPVSIMKRRLRRPGFSEEVILGGVAGRESADTRVMTVRFFEEDGTQYIPPGLLYMRGLTLDTYQDGRWTHARDYYAVRDLEDADADGWTQSCFPDTRGRKTILQEIVLNPVRSAAIFALPEPIEFAVNEILTDLSGTAMFTRRPEERIYYRVVSQWGTPGSDVLNRVGNPEGPVKFIAVPRKFESVRRLAIETVAGRQTRLGVCLSIERFLEENYAYSLEGMPSGPRDPVEIFLFEQKTGCCLDFASAMVIMLRTLKIPSRLACGFAGDEQTAVTGEFLFRGEHAHAWAEVFFGPYGWIRFDPSPLTYAEWRNEARNEGGLLSWLARITDYGEGDRALLLKTLGKVLQKGWWVLLTATFVLSLFLIVRRGGRITGNNHARGGPWQKEVDFYRQFLRIAGRAGVRPHPASTPREVADAAIHFLPREPVQWITETYCAMRYGGLTLDGTSKARMKDALALLKEKASS